MHMADVVVIGAGIIGLSVAYNLKKKDPGLKVIVLEKEKFEGTGSTAACTGGIRYQFSARENIQLSLLSVPFFQSFAEEMGYHINYRQNGYLFVTACPAQMELFAKDILLQQELGVPSELLYRDEIARRFPYLITTDLQGGSFCSIDGSADPSEMVKGYLNSGKRLGVKYFFEEPVIGIGVEKGKVRRVITSKQTVSTTRIINAGGPYAASVAGLAGVNLPVTPYRRQVFVAEPIPSLPRNIPLTVDMDSGFYLHQELNGQLLMGGTDKTTAPGMDISVDWSGLETVAQAAIKRIPLLNEAKISKAYAGLRSVTPDFQPVLGEAQEAEGFYCANGFTGHGFMHAPAIGLLLAELLVDRKVRSMEIKSLSPARFSCSGNDKPKETSIF
ncbi:MAG: FAD-binding oxidoreductase [Syntrophomonadaceae bacterium]|nr:FAD-binding oxidoreductase [Syntrophomonadaceae bacterium]